MKLEQVQIMAQEQPDRRERLVETAQDFLRTLGKHHFSGFTSPEVQLAAEVFLAELARDIVAVYGETD